MSAAVRDYFIRESLCFRPQSTHLLASFPHTCGLLPQSDSTQTPALALYTVHHSKNTQHMPVVATGRRPGMCCYSVIGICVLYLHLMCYKLLYTSAMAAAGPTTIGSDDGCVGRLASPLVGQQLSVSALRCGRMSGAKFVPGGH